MPKGKVSVEKDIIPRVKDIIIDTFCAVKSQINRNHRKNHFELFGYDFLIDEDFRTWLIEVNSNPYIGTPSKFTQ
jgi:D-alanine-D-alanine ligase-like ATP-grasp enzyme